MTDIEKLVLNNARAMHRRVAATEADVVTALEWAAQWKRVAQLQAKMITLYSENARSSAESIEEMASSLSEAMNRHQARSEEEDRRWREIAAIGNAVVEILKEENGR
jgi:hypothetical protein